MQEKKIKHIGIIMDGNRRYAKEKGQNPWDGHTKGAETVEKLMEWMVELNIPQITVYAFSEQNWGRTELEKRFLFKLMEKECDKLLTKKLADLKKHSIRINLVGRLHKFSGGLQKKWKQLMEATKKHNKHIFNIALSYGGQEEITDAVKAIGEKIKKGVVKPEEVTEKMVAEHLYLPTPMDILIRTGGENRTSNFFPWLLAYAELFFVNKYWPAFTKEDLVGVLEEFKQRERRFGK